MLEPAGARAASVFNSGNLLPVNIVRYLSRGVLGVTAGCKEDTGSAGSWPSLDPWAVNWCRLERDHPLGHRVRGLFSLGLGQAGKFSYLPERHTDFISRFSAKNWGLLGICGAAVFILAWRGLKTH